MCFFLCTPRPLKKKEFPSDCSSPHPASCTATHVPYLHTHTHTHDSSGGEASKPIPPQTCLSFFFESCRWLDLHLLHTSRRRRFLFFYYYLFTCLFLSTAAVAIHSCTGSLLVSSCLSTVNSDLSFHLIGGKKKEN